MTENGASASPNELRFAPNAVVPLRSLSEPAQAALRTNAGALQSAAANPLGVRLTRSAVETGDMCGIIQAGSLRLMVLPKKESLCRRFLESHTSIHVLRARVRGEVSIVDSVASALDRELRRGVEWGYTQNTAQEAHFRGRLDVAKQIQQLGLRKDRFVLRTFHREQDTPLNRVLAWLIQRLGKEASLVAKQRLGRLSELVRTPASRHLPDDLARIAWTRSNARYRPFAQLAAHLHRAQAGLHFATSYTEWLTTDVHRALRLAFRHRLLAATPIQWAQTPPRWMSPTLLLAGEHGPEAIWLGGDVHEALAYARAGQIQRTHLVQVLPASPLRRSLIQTEEHLLIQWELDGQDLSPLISSCGVRPEAA